MMAELSKTKQEMIVEMMKTQLKVSVMGHQLKLLKMLANLSPLVKGVRQGISFLL
jgi:hypothetical protein